MVEGATREPPHYLCLSCGNVGFCEAECSLGPWNFDLPSTNRFGHLRRKRRWIDMPLKVGRLIDERV
jgi:hypothetical protein